MQKYTWDYKKLKNELKEISIRLMLEDIPEQEKIKLENKLETILEMKKYLSIPETILKKIKFTDYDKDFDIDDAKETINSYITPFQEELMKEYYEEFLNRDFGYVSKKDLKTCLPRNLKLLFSKEIFLEAGGKIEDFKRMCDPKNHFLNLSNYSSRGCFFSYEKDSYIFSSNKNNVYSFCALIHELGHYFEYCFNDFFINTTDNRNILYEEISSLLFEHIGLDTLKKHGIIDDNKKTAFQKYIMGENTSVADEYFMLKTIINDPNPTFIDKIKVHSYPNTILNTTYYYSYIIAISLYYQYIDNSKEAINNLKHLLTNFNEENELKLLEESDIDLSGNTLRKHLDKLKRNN